MDYETGQSLNDAGQIVEPILGGRRKHPKLIDMLETGRRHHALRLMLCGAVPRGGSWLLPTEAMTGRGEQITPGWVDDGHWLEDPPRGRFRHVETGHKLVVALAREWFPEATEGPHLNPRQAWACWQTLSDLVSSVIGRDWALMSQPGQTGLNLWKLRAPDSYNMDPMDRTIGELIQATEPQHRFEHYVAGAGRCGCGDCVPLIPAGDIEGFAYADGRFMFHGAPPRELGAAPARMLTGAQAAEMFAADRWHPARYQVRFTVPDHWDTLGMFALKHDLGWHWPNRPGATGAAWCDVAELRLATMWGWKIEMLEGIQLTKANSLGPLVNLTSTLLSKLDNWQIDGQTISLARRQVIAAAIRHMFRVTVGSFSRRPKLQSGFATDMAKVPASATGPVTPAHGGFIYTTISRQHPTWWETWHPEIAARVWGTSRAAVLATPTAPLPSGSNQGQRVFGALEVPPDQMIGIQGDALYTTRLLPWTLPIAAGGGDDGRTGRIRIKGYLPGPLQAPATVAERQKLSNQAEHAGWERQP